jgi:hypothetical protein
LYVKRYSTQAALNSKEKKGEKIFLEKEYKIPYTVYTPDSDTLMNSN